MQQVLTPDTNEEEEEEENDPMSEHSDSESLEGENEQSTGIPGDVIVETIFEVAEHMKNIALKLKNAIRLCPRLTHQSLTFASGHYSESATGLRCQGFRATICYTGLTTNS